MSEKPLQPDVSDCLQKAISKALDSYHCFMEQDAPEDAKGFTAHHNAAKVAIAHVELLLKIAKSSSYESAANNGTEELKGLLKEAQDEVETYKSRQELRELEGDDGESS